MRNKHKKTLQKELARLESAQDHIETEFTQLDDLLKLVGFEYGLASLKAVCMKMQTEAEQ